VYLQSADEIELDRDFLIQCVKEHGKFLKKICIGFCLVDDVGEFEKFEIDGVQFAFFFFFFKNTKHRLLKSGSEKNGTTQHSQGQTHRRRTIYFHKAHQ
jgi:hypothetical protein